jgi:cytochrome c-type biogenesis protein CcmH
MLTFYLIAGGLAVLAAGMLARPLIAGRGAAESRDARDARVFRDQLAELERDLARGTITPGEAEGARIEISRRLIAADARARRADAPRPAPQGRSGLVAGVALIGTPALAAALYLGIGAPGVPDQPLAGRQALAGDQADHTSARPGQEQAEAEMAGRLPPPEDADPQFAAIVARLERTLAGRPDDAEGHRLLAGALMQLGRYGEAWRAYDRVIGLAGGAAGADIHAAKAEAMIMAAGGYVSPEAADAIARALERDPTLPMARYYGGLALRQAGRLDDAIAMWQALRRASSPDAPYLEWLDAMLADAVAAREGAPAAPGSTPAAAPEAPPGPTEEDVAAAGQMSAEDRATMVEGMVGRLENRLVAQGGTAEEWLRLIRSFVQLDRPADARRAYALAAAALADDPAAGFVREQALLMGVPVQ